MTFVSYAQCFEDVMLWRALGHVGTGFYIDVGAQHPDDDSVTRAFYDRGWHGINIEPVPANARRIRASRWRDTTLAVACGAQPGRAVLRAVGDTGLSTLDPALADRYRTDGRTVVETEVAVETLAAICREHVRGPVHFLKVDVEGLERAVLEGADFAAVRPWIVLVEATSPMSTVPTHAEWEPILLAADYHFVWFDGLNRFYVAAEHRAALEPSFRTPPNVFDDFIRTADTEYARRTAEAEGDAARFRDRMVAAELHAQGQAHEARGARLVSDTRGQELARMGEVLHATRHRHLGEHAAWLEQLRAVHVQLDAERALGRAEHDLAFNLRTLLDATHRSTSWRVTAPLRRVVGLVRGGAAPALPPVAPNPEADVADTATGGPAHAPAPAPARLRAVHQFHSGSAVGDAITNAMLMIQRLLRSSGYRSDIFVQYPDPALGDAVRPMEALPPGGYVLVHHHSMGFDRFDAIKALPVPKVLVFHNITPPEFLPGEPFLQEHARLGRLQLAELRPLVVASLADSEFNAVELRRLGFDMPAAAPLLFDIDALRARADAAVAAHRPAPGKPFTVLFVGRITPSKAQDALVAAFAAFAAAFAGPARLVLAGRSDGAADGYAAGLRAQVGTAGLADRVEMTGLVSDAALHALYAEADLYVSLSLHEGFGVPLVEAMAHGVPVLAWPAGAVPYTLGGAAVLLTDRSPDAVAAAMLGLARDPAARAAVARRQTRGLDRFRLDRHLPTLVQALVQAGAVPPAPPDSRAALDANMCFTVAGHVAGSYSLAAVNRDLAEALEAARPGRVRLRPVEGVPTAAPPGLPASLAALAARPPHATAPHVVISQHYPVHVPEDRGDLLLAWFFWEESVVPPDTVRQLNTAFDGVLAPSAFVAKVLVDSGLTIPVRTVGFAPALQAFARLPRAPGPAEPGFTFLHVSSCFPRKGVDVLLAAYAAAFRDTDPVRLVVKGFPNPHNDVADQVARLRQADPHAPEVQVIDRDLDAAALRALFAEADAVVLPTRGEGFNIPAAEAMAAGVPLVVTGHGGQMDFCGADTARLLRFRFARSGSHLASAGSVWADPDPDDLRAALREAVERPDEAARRARAARTAAASLADGAAFARRVADAALDIMLAPRPVPVRIGWVSTWNVRCGVAEYSRHLVGALPRGPGLAGITVLCDRRTPGPAPGPAPDANPGAVTVVPCWDLRDVEGIDTLLAALAAADPGVVVVQHQPGLFRWRNLGLLLRGPALAGRPVVVVLHNTRHLLDTDAEERRYALHGLAAAARVVVHTAADLNLLHDLGIAGNTVLLPHGATPAADPADPRAPSAADAPVVGCYGFFLPGKGIPQLIEALAVLRRTRPTARLCLVNAEYDLPASAGEIAACRALAERLKVPVDWHTTFLPHEGSHALLRGCDVVALAYQDSKEASSAAIRTVLAAGTPVAVTPLPVFDEVEDAVFRFSGTGPDAIAAGLDTLLADADRRAALRAAGRDWLSARDWQSVAARFEGMLLGLARAA